MNMTPIDNIFSLIESDKNTTDISYNIQGNGSFPRATEVFQGQDTMRRTVNDVLFKKYLIPALIYVIILCIIGIPGNTLVCYVYHQKWRKRKKTSTFFILALSWFDLLNTIVTLPFEITLIINYVDFDHAFICKLSRFLTYFMNAASSVVLMGIAIDRFIGIWCSVRTRPFGISRAKGTVFLSLFLALITCWPALVLFGTKTTPTQNGALYLKTCGIDDKFGDKSGKLHRFPFIYGMYLLGSNIIVDSIFIVIYSLIGIKIYRRRSFGAPTTSRAPTSFVFKHKRPSMVSYTSSTCFDEETTSLTSNSRHRINFVARLVKEDSTNVSESNMLKYGSLRRSFQSRFRFPSTHSVPEEDLHAIKPIAEDESQANFLQVDRPIRSASLPNCNMMVHKQTSSRMKTWNFRKLPRSVSNTSHASGNDSNTMGRYGRTYHTGKTTFMLFLVTLAYILTFVPYCILNIISKINPDFYLTIDDVSKNVFQLFFRSYLLSSAINPIIYSFLNRRFRQECFSIIKNIMCVAKLRCKKVSKQ